MSNAGAAAGQILLAQHQALITASAIKQEVADVRGYRTVTVKAELASLGFSRSQQRVPALLLPTWGVSGEIVTYHIRPDEPRIGKNGKPLKYEFPTGSTMALDAHPHIREQLRNPKIPLWITEGVRKADAAISKGLCCIAVIGVWNWRGTNAHGGKTALADWEVIALNGREVYIAYDSDVMLKPQVHDALARLAAFLASRGAHNRYVYLPSAAGGTKVGLDDYLAVDHGVDDLLAFASFELHRLVEDGTDADQRYAVTEAGTLWFKPAEDGVSDVLLANFSAVITEEIIEDDGFEERRIYGIEATAHGTCQRVEIPAAQFAGMSWVGERLGASAVLEPGLGTKDRFRHAIQTLSGKVPQCRVYTHTGWRQIDGSWVYLHGAGAIGPDGPVSGITVRLEEELAHFALPDPRSGEAVIEATRVALMLNELLPAEVAFPLLSATWLAPLRELLGADSPDFVPWLHGPSGSHKTGLLALVQGFFGDFSALSLPVNFSATANALERLMFAAKDALLVVDDFHPANTVRGQEAMNQVADRLLRSAGNLAGRTRMRQDTTLRSALRPRCLVMASGERLPEGHSNVARMYPIAVTKDAITLEHLTTAQEQRHHYPLALAGYLSHLAGCFNELQDTLPRRFRHLHAELQVAGSHRREPGQLAHLLLGFETFLDFAVQIGAITSVSREEYLARERQVLLGQAREHAEAQAEEAPEQLFLRYLRDDFAGKRAYVEGRHGGAPDDAALWGWEQIASRDQFEVPLERWQHGSAAQLVGVLDGEWLLLYPEQVYQFVVGAAKAAGRTFPVEQKTLLRRLDEAGLIAAEIECGQRRRTVNVWIGGATKRVVKLRRVAIMLPSSAKDREEREGREDPLESHSRWELSPSR